MQAPEKHRGGERHDERERQHPDIDAGVFDVVEISRCCASIAASSGPVQLASRTPSAAPASASTHAFGTTVARSAAGVRRRAPRAGRARAGATCSAPASGWPHSYRQSGAPVRRRPGRSAGRSAYSPLAHGGAGSLAHRDFDWTPDTARRYDRRSPPFLPAPPQEKRPAQPAQGSQEVMVTVRIAEERGVNLFRRPDGEAEAWWHHPDNRERLLVVGRPDFDPDSLTERVGAPGKMPLPYCVAQHDHLAPGIDIFRSKGPSDDGRYVQDLEEIGRRLQVPRPVRPDCRWSARRHGL